MCAVLASSLPFLLKSFRFICPTANAGKEGRNEGWMMNDGIRRKKRGRRRRMPACRSFILTVSREVKSAENVIVPICWPNSASKKGKLNDRGWVVSEHQKENAEEAEEGSYTCTIKTKPYKQTNRQTQNETKRKREGRGRLVSEETGESHQILHRESKKEVERATLASERRPK